MKSLTLAELDTLSAVDIKTVDPEQLFLVDLPDIASQPPTVNRPNLLQQQQGGRGKARHILQQNMGRKVGLSLRLVMAAATTVGLK